MGFWSTLGKIGLIAGGGIATALTAGAASPLLATAIGAGIGAGTGAGTAAIDHKNIWKGMASGAALGGATGGLGSVLGGAKGGLDAVSGLTPGAANVVSKATPGFIDTLKAVGTKAATDMIGGNTPVGMTPPYLPEGQAGGDEGVPVDAATANKPGFMDQLKAAGKKLIMGEGGIMRVVNAGGSVAGGLAEGMSKGRDKEVINASTVNTMDILQRKAALDNRGKNYGDAMRSALALNTKDARFDNLPAGVNMVHMTGGLRPSAFGAQGNAAATAMNTQAMEGLNNPKAFLDLPETKAGTLENTLGYAAAVTKGLGQPGEEAKQDNLTAMIKELLRQQGGVGAPKPEGPFVKAEDAEEDGEDV